MIRTLQCNQCGAALHCPDQTRFLQCNHCNSQLEIQQTPDATFTKVVQQLVGTTESIANKLDNIEHQQALAELDRRWGAERQRYLNSDQSIPQSPSLIGPTLLAGFSVVFGTVVLLVSFISEVFLCGLFVPLLLFVVTGIALHRSFEQAAAYRAAEQRYLARRRQLDQRSPRS